MNRLLQFIERKPLGVSLFALIVSLPLLGAVAVPSQRRPGVHMELEWTLVRVFCVALGSGLLGVVGLTSAEKRGYSSTKIGLSVAALFFAFVPMLFFAIRLMAIYNKA